MSLETAIFAGGCFWCMVQPFDTYPGIEKVESGYTGGHVPNPTYEQVCSGTTGHTEAVRITYDPSKVSYGKLVAIRLMRVASSKTGEIATGQLSMSRMNTNVGLRKLQSERSNLVANLVMPRS